MMSVKEEPQDLLACCICLATDTKLYCIQEAKLHETFVNLMGTQTWYMRQSVCALCHAQLARAAALRTRGLCAQALLTAALKHSSHITVDYIQTIDRVAEKLCLNLKTYHVYSSDSTVPDIKNEDIKEETDDFTESIFVSEPTLDFEDEDYDDNTFEDTETNKTDFIENENSIKVTNNINDYKNVVNSESYKVNHSKTEEGNNVINSTKETKKYLETRKATKKKATDSNKITKNNLKTNKLTKSKQKRTENETNNKKDSNNKLTDIKSKNDTNAKTKRVIKRRMAANGFLPDFNFEEFESKYNVKIEILSKEEQLREIETRKMAQSYALAAFGCEQCGKGFATKQVYETHMMKHDVSSGAHACSVCGVRFGTRSRAHVHADAHRLRFTCGVCGFLTRTRFIAKNHYLSHAGTTHKCPHCEAAFSKYTSYLTHVRRRHPAMNVACDLCGETFVGHNGLRHHQTRVHKQKLSKPSQNKCASCGALFAHAAALAAHSAGGCSPDDNPCRWCGARVADAAAQARHGDACDARSHQCRECNKTFLDKSSYDTHYSRIHLNIGSKESPRARARPPHHYMCEQCGAECASVSSLAVHQLRHAGVRPHPCPAAACPLRFGTLHNMRRHHRVVHLGQRPAVACGVCGKLLAHAASLKLHVNTVHLKLPAPRRARRQDDK